MFVILVCAVVVIIGVLLVMLARISQGALIDRYIVKVGYSNSQKIADAVAELKKVDLQEIFRELLILDALVVTSLDNPTYVSSSYLSYSKANNLISSSECVSVCKPPSVSPKMRKITYLLFPQEMSYSKLANYPPADTDVNTCAFIFYWLASIFEFNIIDIQKERMYLGFFSELFCVFPSVQRPYFIGKNISKT